MTIRVFTALSVAVLITPALRSQDMQLPKPGPEHELLKRLEGTWDAKVNMMGAESTGVMTYKMTVNGLLLESDFEGTMAGQKYHGRGLDSYDPRKGKFVGYWFDSLSATPAITEGTYDKATKTRTMLGDVLGPNGMQKAKFVTKERDDGSLLFTLLTPEGADQPAVTIVYTRRK